MRPSASSPATSRPASVSISRSRSPSPAARGGRATRRAGARASRRDEDTGQLVGAAQEDRQVRAGLGFEVFGQARHVGRLNATQVPPPGRAVDRQLGAHGLRALAHEQQAEVTLGRPGDGGEPGAVVGHDELEPPVRRARIDHRVRGAGVALHVGERLREHPQDDDRHRRARPRAAARRRAARRARPRCEKRVHRSSSAGRSPPSPGAASMPFSRERTVPCAEVTAARSRSRLASSRRSRAAPARASRARGPARGRRAPRRRAASARARARCAGAPAAAGRRRCRRPSRSPSRRSTAAAPESTAGSASAPPITTPSRRVPVPSGSTSQASAGG